MARFAQIPTSCVCRSFFHTKLSIRLKYLFREGKSEEKFFQAIQSGFFARILYNIFCFFEGLKVQIYGFV